MKTTLILAEICSVLTIFQIEYQIISISTIQQKQNLDQQKCTQLEKGNFLHFYLLKVIWQHALFCSRDISAILYLVKMVQWYIIARWSCRTCACGGKREQYRFPFQRDDWKEGEYKGQDVHIPVANFNILNLVQLSLLPRHEILRAVFVTHTGLCRRDFRTARPRPVMFRFEGMVEWDTLHIVFTLNKLSHVSQRLVQAP